MPAALPLPPTIRKRWWEGESHMKIPELELQGGFIAAPLLLSPKLK